METGLAGTDGRHVRLRVEVASKVVLDHVPIQCHLTGVEHAVVLHGMMSRVILTHVQVGFHK